MTPLRGVAAGAGYFSQFHYDAWGRASGAALVALCDISRERAEEAARRFGVGRVYTDVAAMLDAERPDFIDIITPPSTHREICRLAAQRGVHVLCQKALAPTFEDAVALVEEAEGAGIRLMVHDNFRFQPWHREMRRLLDLGTIGPVHAIACRTRLGDGWGSAAYLDRQPYFRTMPKLLVFETGVHFIDVFRYLVGEVRQVYAALRRRNQVIAGEDAGLMMFEFQSGATGVWDASRYNESLDPDPRYTFGEFLVEGPGGALRVDERGRLLVHALGATPQQHAYVHQAQGFAGDCCYRAIQHFVDRLHDGSNFETSGRDYLRTLAVQEALYESATAGQAVEVREPGSGGNDA
jgi:predicted dehydrogenase